MKILSTFEGQAILKPTHYVENQAEYLTLIDDYFEPLGKKCVSQLKRCIKSPSNLLWDDYLYHFALGGRKPAFSYDDPSEWEGFAYQKEHEPDEIYIPFSRTHKCPGRNHQQAELVAKSDQQDAQEDLSYFANFLQYGWQDPNYNWNRPSDRVYGGPFFTFTIEYDGDSSWTLAQKRDFLKTQLGWFRKTRSNDLDRPIGEVYRHFSGYSDFLGLSGCYSGNKSVHIHLLFFAETLFEDTKLSRENVRGGYKHLWAQVNEEVHRILEPSVTSDPAMQEPEQYRKLPNGLFTSHKEDHILNIPPGTQIPLICLWEKFNSRAAPNANKPFLTKKAFVDHPGKSTPHRQSNHTRIGDMSPQEHNYCSQEFNNLIERVVGKNRYPKGAGLHKENVWLGRLYACKGDNNPSSIICEHATLLKRQGGKEPDNPVKLSMPLRFYIQKWRIEYAKKNGLPCPKLPGNNLIPSIAEKPEEIDFRENASDMETAYSMVEGTIIKVMDNCPFGFVKAPEGSRKTTAAMQHVPDLLNKLISDAINALPDDAKDWQVEDEDRHNVIFAFSSYNLATEKAAQFSEMHQDSNYVGIVLNSFSREYQDCLGVLNITQPVTKANAAQLGYQSHIAAIRELQKEVWALMRKRHEDYHKCLCANGVKLHPIFFAAHQTLHNWSNDGITSVYWHRDFFESEPRDWGILRKSMRLRLAVHDEVSVDHLLDYHKAADVEWYQGMKASSSSWDSPDCKLDERYNAFQQYKDSNPNQLEFDEVCKIHDIGYGKADKRSVRGIENYDHDNAQSKLYAKSIGNAWHAKPKDWWHASADRVLILTTEALPTAMLQGWNAELSDKQKADGKAFHIYSLHSPSLITDSIMVQRENGCQSKNAGKVISGIRKQHGDDLIVVSNCAAYVPNTETHAGIKGSNRLMGNNVAQIVFHKPPEEYETLELVNDVFDLQDAIKLSHVDQINQTAGRNLGFRQVDVPVNHHLVMGHALWNKLEDTLHKYCRYDLTPCETAMQRKHKRHNTKRSLKEESRMANDDMLELIEEYDEGRL